MNLDIESRHKLRDMGAGHLLGALEAQDDAVCMGLTFAERLQMAVDEAYSDYINKTVAGLIKKAKLRIPQADVRTIDYLEGRNLDRQTLVELSTCGFVNRCNNFLLEVTERKCMESTIIFCTQFRKGDWHARLGGGVQADAIMDRIVHNTVWVFAGDINMREHYAKKDRGTGLQDAQSSAD